MSQPYRKGYTPQEWIKWIDTERVLPQERLKLAAQYTNWTWSLVKRLYDFDKLPNEFTRYSPYLERLIDALGQNTALPDKLWNRIVISLAKQSGHKSYRDWDWMAKALEQPRVLDQDALQALAKLAVKESQVLLLVLEARGAHDQFLNHSLFRKLVLGQPEVENFSSWNKIFIGAPGWADLWAGALATVDSIYNLYPMIETWEKQKERADEMTPGDWGQILDSWQSTHFLESDALKGAIELYAMNQLTPERLAKWSKPEIAELLAKPLGKDLKMSIWNSLMNHDKSPSQRPVARVASF